MRTTSSQLFRIITVFSHTRFRIHFALLLVSRALTFALTTRCLIRVVRKMNENIFGDKNCDGWNRVGAGIKHFNFANHDL